MNANRMNPMMFPRKFDGLPSPLLSTFWEVISVAGADEVDVEEEKGEEKGEEEDDEVDDEVEVGAEEEAEKGEVKKGIPVSLFVFSIL
jgi:hypothetical protein